MNIPDQYILMDSAVHVGDLELKRDRHDHQIHNIWTPPFQGAGTHLIARTPSVARILRRVQ